MIASNFFDKLQKLREWDRKAKAKLGKFFWRSCSWKNIHDIPQRFSWFEINTLSLFIPSLRQKMLLGRLCSLLFWFLFNYIIFLVLITIVPILVPKFICFFTSLITVGDVKLPIQTPISLLALEKSGRTLVEGSFA
jgi:hypothetical protein